MKVLLLKSLMGWAVILCLAIVNGALREAILIPSFGRMIGLATSGVLLSLLVVLIAFGFVRLAPGVTVLQGIFVGFLWLCLTLVFEFTFGHYVQRKPLAELLEAYAFTGGNIWPVVLVVTLLAPLFAALFHSKSKYAKSGA